MFLVGVLVVLLGVLLSIALHEVGHLVPAKRFGVKVNQYMVGFGRTLWSRTSGETEYGIKAIPLGGYVRMIGMFPPKDAASPARRRPGTTSMFATLADDARSASSAEVAPGEEHRAFYALSVPKKLVVMFGGPVMNLLIAIVLFTVVLTGFGLATLTTTLGSVAECVTPVGEPDRECIPSDSPAPGAAAGLEPGDTVLTWGGVEVSEWSEVSAAIRASGTAPVDVVVLRDGVERSLMVTPVLADRPVVVDGEVVTNPDGEPELAPVPFVGIGPTVALVPQPLAEVPAFVGNAVAQTIGVVITLPQRMVAIADAAFGGGERDPSVVGLVGVGRFAGEIASADVASYGLKERSADLLALIASLNLALFAFNLLPLLPLDGGHLAGALWEGIRRQAARVRGRPDPGPVDVARAMPLAYAVIVVLLGMSLVLAYADIVRPVTLGG